MKTGVNKTGIRLILSLVLFYSLDSCKKSVPAPAFFGNTILQQLQQDSDFVLFNTAMIRAHIDTVFANGGPYTVFAPPDSAFISAGWTLSKIMAASPDSLKTILGYDIVNGKISSADLVGFLNEKVTSLDSGLEPEIIKNFYGIFFNGSQVVQQSELADGVLNKISDFVTIPTGNLFQTINSRPDLTVCADIISKNLQLSQTQISFTNAISLPALLQYPADTYFNEMAENNSTVNFSFKNFTLFLPSDSAFKAAGYTVASIDSACNADADFRYFLVNNIVPEWIVEGEFFTSNFIHSGFLIFNYSNGIYATRPNPPANSSFFLGGPYIVIDADGLSIYTQSHYPLAKIIRPDIPATNGVIHIIDTVFN